MTVYFISGLGADKRAFQRIKLPPDIKVQHIERIEPKKKETLTSYCNRLSACIDSSEEFSIVGLSFGGMVAIEIAKSLNPKQIIIISSIATKQELPLIYKLLGWSGLHKLAPSFLFKEPNILVYWFFGAITEGEKRLFRQFLHNSSPFFLKWSIDKILNWKNEKRHGKLFHIHGTNDKIFPVKLTHADIRIEGGRHFMVYSKADMINPIINERLAL